MRYRLGRYGVPLVLLGLLAVLGFSGLLGTYVIEPVAAVLWAGWRVVASVDQAVYWILLVVLCSLLTIRIFSTRDPGQPVPENSGIPVQRTRVEHWQAMFQNAELTREGDAALRESLRSLLESVVAQQDQPPRQDFGTTLSSRHISLPPGVQSYLALGVQSRSASPIASVRNALRRLFQRPVAQDEAAIDEVLQWMEAAMEMSHDQ